MKKFVKRFTIFLVPLLVVLAGISLFFKKGPLYSNAPTAIKTRMLINKQIDSELVIWGSSVAEGAFNPQILSEELGLTSFNMGYSGRKIFDWIGFFNSYFSYSKKTKYVIFEIFPNSFNENENKVLYFPQFFYSYLEDPFIYSNFQEYNENAWKFRDIPFYILTDLNKKYFEFALGGVLSFLKKKEVFHNYGFNSPKTINFGKGEAFRSVVISKKGIMFYTDAIRRLIEKDIKIVFVATPVYKAGMSKFQNVDTVYNLCNSWADNEKVFFLDYSRYQEFVSQQKYFNNNTHLNVEGASVFTKKLANDLTKIVNGN